MWTCVRAVCMPSALSRAGACSWESGSCNVHVDFYKRMPKSNQKTSSGRREAPKSSQKASPGRQGMPKSCPKVFSGRWRERERERERETERERERGGECAITGDVVPGCVAAGTLMLWFKYFTGSKYVSGCGGISSNLSLMSTYMNELFN